jgi:hypothetical protein
MSHRILQRDENVIQMSHFHKIHLSVQDVDRKLDSVGQSQSKSLTMQEQIFQALEGAK